MPPPVSTIVAPVDAPVNVPVVPNPNAIVVTLASDFDVVKLTCVPYAVPALFVAYALT